MLTLKYSIITPVYNRADSIGRCIESVIRSYGQDIEHVIVDDGSSDETAAIVEQYAKQYEHIKFIKFPQNRGTNAARNAAIAAAHGEWCIILDSDDYFVNDAISIVRETMAAKPGYKHYMFAADDMQSQYASNAIIKGRDQCVLTYADFLNGHVDGDYIHVCNTEILRRHPFDEQLRIYEGLFFLQFYREARQMLFINKVVTIRERSRSDSVTREVIRTNKRAIEKQIRHDKLLLIDFGDEMQSLGMAQRLSCIRLNLLDNIILLGKYSEARDIIKTLKPLRGYKGAILNLIYILRLGWLYRIALSLYLNAKYKLFNHSLS